MYCLLLSSIYYIVFFSVGFCHWFLCFLSPCWSVLLRMVVIADFYLHPSVIFWSFFISIISSYVFFCNHATLLSVSLCHYLCVHYSPLSHSLFIFISHSYLNLTDTQEPIIISIPNFLPVYCRRGLTDTGSHIYLSSFWSFMCNDHPCIIE